MRRLRVGTGALASASDVAAVGGVACRLINSGWPSSWCTADAQVAGVLTLAPSCQLGLGGRRRVRGGHEGAALSGSRPDRRVPAAPDLDPAVQVFLLTLAAMGGWPWARCCCRGRPSLAGSLSELRVTSAVPLAADEPEARQLSTVAPDRIPILSTWKRRSRRRSGRVGLSGAVCTDWRPRRAPGRRSDRFQRAGGERRAARAHGVPVDRTAGRDGRTASSVTAMAPVTASAASAPRCPCGFRARLRHGGEQFRSSPWARPRPGSATCCARPSRTRACPCCATCSSPSTASSTRARP